MADFSDPYESIREYWGEELTPTLADRIVDAPVDHLDHFRSFLLDRDRSTEITLPDLPPGELRPFVSIGVIDFLSGNNAGLAAAKLATSLLIYAHQVVISDVAGELYSVDTEKRRAATNWLIAVKQLFDDGLIHFRMVDIRKRHPSWGVYHNHLVELINSVNDPDIDYFVKRCTQAMAKEHMTKEGWENFKGDILYQLLVDVSSFYGYERIWPNRIHRLLRSKAEYAVVSSGGRDTGLDLGPSRGLTSSY